jgi:outer membrane receptor protein involved in Fe transport
MRVKLRLSACVLALSSGVPLAAEDDAETQEVQERPVILVTGRGLDETPSSAIYSVTTLERETIVSGASGRIEDVLLNVAGFQQFRRSDSRSSNPSAQGVTLRALGGNATSRALVLLDGVPVADPFFGYIPLSAIAPESLGQIRVTRGGGSGPFGAGALAGTIELDSVSPASLGPLLASAAVNDRGETEASGLATARLGRGFVIASGRWDRGDGFNTTPAGQMTRASVDAAFESWNGALRAVAPLTETVEMQARVSMFRDNRTLRFRGADSSSEGQDASIRFIGRGDWAFDALAYVQSRDFSNIVINANTFNRALDQRRTPSTGLGGKLELRPPVGEAHTLRVGVDFRRASGELQEEAYNAFTRALTERRRAGGQTDNLGFFIEDDWRIGALTLTGGLRADHIAITDTFYRAVNSAGAVVSEVLGEDRSEWVATWRVGAAYEASENLRLRAAAYTGIRLPTLNELTRPFVVFPVTTQANASLASERLEGFEAGLDWQAGEVFNFSLTAFDNRVKDAIANVTIRPNLRQRQNLPAIAARGIEANVGAEAGQFSLIASVAYTGAQIEGAGASLELDGNRPPQVPRWSGSATLAWAPAVGWRLAATLRHVAAQFEDDLESDVLAPATTLDAFVEVPLGRSGFAAILRGENLTGETIVTRNAGGSIDLGVPRTLWLGVRYGF